MAPQDITSDDSTAMLDYEQSDGQAVYYHDDRDEHVVGTELGTVDNSDEWSMRWYCPRCGEVEPPEEEIAPAGMSSIHLRCATDAEKDLAETQEKHVAANVRNAKAFGDGAYDD